MACGVRLAPGARCSRGRRRRRQRWMAGRARVGFAPRAQLDGGGVARRPRSDSQLMPLAISQTFFLEFASLEKPVRESVGQLIRKFGADSSLRGINLEKPTRTADSRSRTAR